MCSCENKVISCGKKKRFFFAFFFLASKSQEKVRDYYKLDC